MRYDSTIAGRLEVWVALLALGACGDDLRPGAQPAQHDAAPEIADPDAGAPPDPDAGVVAEVFPKPCPDLYAQDLFPTFELDIDDAEWDALEEDRVLWAQREEDGEDIKPYHAIHEFRYGGEHIYDAVIRLKGNPCCSWQQQKMQFVIKFNEIDEDGRFHGLRKLDLDASTNARSMLNDRVALAYLRQLGAPVSCANNARLVINGEYYGVYANLERVDRELLERHFPDPDGNLFKHGRDLETNEDTGNTDVVDRFWHTYDPAELSTFVDVDQMLSVWAAEAVIPQADGYWAGSNNFYLYDDPTRGLVYIAYDLDDTFAHMSSDLDLLALRSGGTPREHFDALMADPVWQGKYLDAVDAALAAYDPDQLKAWTDAWAAQIRQAVKDDPNRPFTFQEHIQAVAAQRAYYGQRATFAGDWSTCQATNTPDADDDGYGWCRDCDDGAGGTHAGATEVCNGVDDDCNGIVDDDDLDSCPDCVALAYGGDDYYICTRPRDFAGSQARCATQGAVVALPRDEDENDFLFAAAQGIDPYMRMYIGLGDDAMEGTWLDLDGGVPGYFNWEPDQPSGAEDTNCVIMDYAQGGKWNDRACADEKYSVACRVP